MTNVEMLASAYEAYEAAHQAYVNATADEVAVKWEAYVVASVHYHGVCQEYGKIKEAEIAAQYGYQMGVSYGK